MRARVVVSAYLLALACVVVLAFAVRDWHSSTTGRIVATAVPFGVGVAAGLWVVARRRRFESSLRSASTRAATPRVAFGASVGLAGAGVVDMGGVVAVVVWAAVLGYWLSLTAQITSRLLREGPATS